MGTVAPVMLIELAPATAVTKPGLHVVPAAGTAATTMLVGKMSVRLAPVIAADGEALLMVTVSSEVSGWEIVAGLKDLLSVALDVTVKDDVAATGLV